MMVGRWVSFWDCLFLGAMLNFRVAYVFFRFQRGLFQVPCLLVFSGGESAFLPPNVGQTWNINGQVNQPCSFLSATTTFWMYKTPPKICPLISIAFSFQCVNQEGPRSNRWHYLGKVGKGLALERSENVGNGKKSSRIPSIGILVG